MTNQQFPIGSHSRRKLATAVAVEYAHGGTIRSVAAAHGISYGLTRTLLHEAGALIRERATYVKRNTAARRELTAIIAADYATGMSIRAIGIKRGLSYTMVNNILAEAGIPRRSRGGANRTGAPERLPDPAT